MINISAGTPFDEHELVTHIRASGRDYIIQGQQDCAFANHTKPHSFDYWLRQNFANNPDTKMGTNSVVAELVATGLFTVVARLRCPDSGIRCKAIRLI